MYKPFFLSLILSVLLAFSCASQKKTAPLSITVNSEVFSNGDTVFFKQYYGKKLETLMFFVFKDQGKAVFEDKKPLPPGIYHIYQTPNTHFDFFISETQPQNFEISYNKKNIQSSLKFKNSPENEIAFEFFNFIDSQDKKINQLKLQKKDDDASLQEAYKETETEISEKVESITKAHPDYCFTDYLLLKQKIKAPTPSIPMFVANRDSVIRAFYTHYARNHFFDHVNFNAKSLSGIPDFEEVIQTYFTQIIFGDKDTTLKYLDQFFAHLNSNPVVYRFCVKYLSRLYLQVPYEHLQSVYPYLLEKYIIEKPQMWDDDVVMAETKEKLRLLKMNEVGSVAADLTLQTPDNKTYQISKMSKKYNILYFFDPDCHTCQEVTPKLHQLYTQYQNRENFDFYAIYVEHDKNIWKSYIDDKQLKWINLWDAKNNQKIESKYDISLLPSIYVLDQNHVVLLRDADLNKLNEFLKNLDQK